MNQPLPLDLQLHIALGLTIQMFSFLLKPLQGSLCAAVAAWFAIPADLPLLYMQSKGFMAAFLSEASD